jgi:hypothetical protein
MGPDLDILSRIVQDQAEILVFKIHFFAISRPQRKKKVHLGEEAASAAACPIGFCVVCTA